MHVSPSLSLWYSLFLPQPSPPSIPLLLFLSLLPLLDWFSLFHTSANRGDWPDGCRCVCVFVCVCERERQEVLQRQKSMTNPQDTHMHRLKLTNTRTKVGTSMNTIFPALCWPASVLSCCPGNFSFKLTRCIKMAASWKGSLSPSPRCNSSILLEIAKQMWMLAHCSIPVWTFFEILKISLLLTEKQPAIFFYFYWLILFQSPDVTWNQKRNYLSGIHSSIEKLSYLQNMGVLLCCIWARIASHHWRDNEFWICWWT